MLGKSVLPRVLIRVTLLLPAHLPVLIGQRVSHSGGCRCVLLDGETCKYVCGWERCFYLVARATINILIPPLTLTVTFHHPEQSLLHKLHWLDHVIRVGVFSVRARDTNTHQTHKHERLRVINLMLT